MKKKVLLRVIALGVFFILSCESVQDLLNDGPRSLGFAEKGLKADAAKEGVTAGSFSAEGGNGALFYNLVPGLGDEDNGLFAVDAADLRIRVKSLEERSYSFRVAVRDEKGQSVEDSFMLKIGAPDKPEPPDNPEPDKPGPDEPENPDPENSGVPEVPGEPGNPELDDPNEGPENPGIPDLPVKSGPDDPGDFEEPQTPGVPKVPDKPGPDDPGAPAPENPGIPGVPELPGNSGPDDPQADTGAPPVPDSQGPDDPREGVDPGVPAVPNLSGDGGTPEGGGTPGAPDIPQNDGNSGGGSNPDAGGNPDEPDPPVAAPVRPRKPQVKVSGGKLAVSWAPAARADTYDLYYRDAAESNSNVPPAAPQLTGIAGERVETALDPVKVWYVWVRAVNTGGASLVSLRGMGGLGPIFSTLADFALWLVSLPQNTPLSPYTVRLDMHMGSSGNPMPGAAFYDGFRPLYDSFGGRYLSLDLDACTGATIGWGEYYIPNPEGRPNRDKLIHAVPPAGATKLGQYNFQDCVNLKTVRFPPNLRAINRNVFEGCVSLEAVDLPATLESIGIEAFSGCSALKTIVCRAATPPSLGGTDVFSGLPETLVIKVPAASVSAYKTQWSAYAAKITALKEGE
jgi:hypothetical protein